MLHKTVEGLYYMPVGGCNKTPMAYMHKTMCYEPHGILYVLFGLVCINYANVANRIHANHS